MIKYGHIGPISGATASNMTSSHVLFGTYSVPTTGINVCGQIRVFDEVFEIFLPK